uniref:Uncharacterized protein n=1 Tax=Arundo donax TaxID=35708 RepID=A0A0A8ZEF2_ARUDO
MVMGLGMLSLLRWSTVIFLNRSQSNDVELWLEFSVFIKNVKVHEQFKI